jgi:hypothetical protein
MFQVFGELKEREQSLRLMRGALKEFAKIA